MRNFIMMLSQDVERLEISLNKDNDTVTILGISKGEKIKSENVRKLTKSEFEESKIIISICK